MCMCACVYVCVFGSVCLEWARRLVEIEVASRISYNTPVVHCVHTWLIMLVLILPLL